MKINISLLPHGVAGIFCLRGAFYKLILKETAQEISFPDSSFLLSGIINLVLGILLIALPFVIKKQRKPAFVLLDSFLFIIFYSALAAWLP